LGGDALSAALDLIGDLGGDQGEVGDALKGLTGDAAAGKGGFSFRILVNPVKQVLGLLMGKDADLVAYDLAPLDFNFELSVFFPILGPLGVSIGLTVDFTADTAFVYDTHGIRRFVESGFDNP